MILPLVTFALFALLAAAGTYLAVARFRRRGVAVAAALGVLAGFVALALALARLIAAAGL